MMVALLFSKFLSDGYAQHFSVLSPLDEEGGIHFIFLLPLG